MIKDFVFIWKVFLVLISLAGILRFCTYSDKEYNKSTKEYYRRMHLNEYDD